MTPTAYQKNMRKLLVKGAPAQAQPPAGTGLGAEIGDGTTGIYPGSTVGGIVTARAFAEFVFNAPNIPTVTEQWVIVDVNTWHTGEMTFQHQSATPKHLDPPLRDALKAELGASLQLFTVTFNYLPVPSANVVATLPSTNPAGVTGRFFELRTIQAGGNFTGSPNGYLYREDVVTTVGGVQTTNYTEHYVLLGSYFLPVGTDLGRFTPVSAGAPTTLKAFLTSMIQVVDAQSPADKANTRYIQTQFTLGAL